MMDRNKEGGTLNIYMQDFIHFLTYNEHKTQNIIKGYDKKKKNVKQEQDVDFTATYINFPIIRVEHVE